MYALVCCLGWNPWYWRRRTIPRWTYTISVLKNIQIVPGRTADEGSTCSSGASCNVTVSFILCFLLLTDINLLLVSDIRYRSQLAKCSCTSSIDCSSKLFLKLVKCHRRLSILPKYSMVYGMRLYSVAFTKQVFRVRTGKLLTSGIRT
jgi:hypothetical protein